MNGHRVFGLSLIGAAIALFLFVAVAGSHASGQGSTDFAGTLAPVASSRPTETASTAPVLPPNTGDAALLTQEQRALPLWAGLLWAGLSLAAVVGAGFGGVALLKATRD